VDHIGILKRAWNITWRYKALWILGLFAGGAGGNSGGSRGFNNLGSNSGSGTSRLQPQADELTRWAESHLALLILIGVALILIGLLLWVISIAAKGGLVWLSNEAADEREVRAGRGWRAGFHFWGRTFLIGLLLALPILAIVLVIGFVVAVMAIGAGGLAGSSGNPAAAFGSILGACGVFAVALIVLVPLAIVIGLLSELGLRHAVLDDMHAIPAIKAAWWDLRNRVKDVLIMWLLLIVTGVVYGIVALVVVLAFVAPSVLLILAGAWPIGALLIFVGILVLLVPSAIYNTFYSTSWTVFFRRMTGREIVPPRVAPAYAGGYPQAPQPPAYPPAPPMPPMPPMPPAPGEQPPQAPEA
jgi:hypothetical protein